MQIPWRTLIPKLGEAACPRTNQVRLTVVGWRLEIQARLDAFHDAWIDLANSSGNITFQPEKDSFWGEILAWKISFLLSELETWIDFKLAGFSILMDLYRESFIFRNYLRKTIKQFLILYLISYLFDLSINNWLINYLSQMPCLSRSHPPTPKIHFKFFIFLPFICHPTCAKTFHYFYSLILAGDSRLQLKLFCGWVYSCDCHSLTHENAMYRAVRRKINWKNAFGWRSRPRSRLPPHSHRFVNLSVFIFQHFPYKIA